MGWMSAALSAGKKVVTQVAKEKAKEKRYSIYGEEYTINELKYISKGLNKGDNQISVFNEHLKNKRLKDAVDILKLNNLIK